MVYRDELPPVNVEKLHIVQSIAANQDPIERDKWLTELLASRERSKQHVDANMYNIKCEESMKAGFVYFCEHAFVIQDDNGDDIPAFSSRLEHQNALCDRIRMYLIYRAQVTPGQNGALSRPAVSTIHRWKNMMTNIVVDHFRHNKSLLDRILRGDEYTEGVARSIGQVCGHIAESMDLPRRCREREFFGPPEFVILLDHLNVAMTEQVNSPSLVLQDICALQLAMLTGVRVGGITMGSGSSRYLKENAFSFHRDLKVNKDGRVVDRHSSTMFGVSVEYTIFKGFNSALSAAKERTAVLRPASKAWNIALHPNVTLLPLFMHRGVLFEQGTGKQILNPDDLFASSASRLVVDSDDPFQQLDIREDGKILPRPSSSLLIHLCAYNRYLGLSEQGGLHAWRHDVGDQASIMLGYEQARTLLVHDTRKNTLENHYSRNIQHLDLIGMRLGELDKNDPRVVRLARSRYETLQLSGHAAKLTLKRMHLEKSKEKDKGKPDASLNNGRKVIKYAVDKAKVQAACDEDKIHKNLKAQCDQALIELQEVTPWDVMNSSRYWYNRLKELPDTDEELIEKRKIRCEAHRKAVMKLAGRRACVRGKIARQEEKERNSKPLQASAQEEKEAAQASHDRRHQVVLPPSLKGKERAVDDAGMMEAPSRSPEVDDADMMEGLAYGNLSANRLTSFPTTLVPDSFLHTEASLGVNVSIGTLVRAGVQEGSRSQPDEDYEASLRQKYDKGKGKAKELAAEDALEDFDDTEQPDMPLFKDTDPEVVYQTLIRYYFGVLKGREVHEELIEHIVDIGFCPFCDPFLIGQGFHSGKIGLFVKKHDSDLQVKEHLRVKHQDILAKVFSGQEIDDSDAVSLPGFRFSAEDLQVAEEIQAAGEPEVTEEMMVDHLRSSHAEEEHRWRTSKPIADKYMEAYLTQLHNADGTIDWPFQK
ncbi:hypothetical protein CBS101457_000745 [Exobasidium rhododendri]|nr:hypothetical protein CBS101457_000745 [Exobasidium rhododendri]